MQTPATKPNLSAGGTSLSKNSLRPAQRQLLAVFQRTRFGTIPRLPIAAGLPVLRGVRVKRTVRIGGANEPHPASRAANSVLCREFVEFFQLLDRLGDGEILDLTIRNGLPVSFELQEVLTD